MAICQIMISDFLYGWGRYCDGKEAYSDNDLIVGIEFAEWLAKEGLKPVLGWLPSEFIDWAQAQREHV